MPSVSVLSQLVRDVRTDVVAYSDNPASALAAYLTDAAGNRVVMKGLSLSLDYEAMQSYILQNYPTAGAPIYTGDFDPDDAVPIWAAPITPTGNGWGIRCARLTHGRFRGSARSRATLPTRCRCGPTPTAPRGRWWTPTATAPGT